MMELDGTKPAQSQRNDVAAREGKSIACSTVDLVAALSFVEAHFEPYVPEINALNVFPVPDGDTGTNMLLTLRACVQATRQAAADGASTVAQLLNAASRGALMGARGNSGVILYQMVEGIAQAAPDSTELHAADLVSGLSRAADLAYRAVVNPVEGTMLTVARAAARAAASMTAPDSVVGDLLETALHGAEEALDKTPEMLPVLRQAGVVDAGGRGLVVILDGLRRFTLGQEPARPRGAGATDIASAMTFLDQVELVHGVDEFGYCTNFLLTGSHLNIDRVRSTMDELGSSAVIVGNDQAIKVHVHSEHPGTILEAMLKFGELEEVRIDNMAAQTRKLLSDRSHHATPATRQPASVPIAVVAVASGSGLARALQGMGANLIVDGGPTNNPSTEEILAVVESAPSDTVIVLPNDPNVIASAGNVARLTEKTVRVIPSETVPQGISALSAFNLGLHLDDNVEAMTAALGLVTTVVVTRASRDAHIHGVRAKQGEFIGLVNGTMVAAGQDLVEVTLGALGNVKMADAELVTIFAGRPADPRVVKNLAGRIADLNAHLTVEIAEGDQPHYDVILAVE